MKKIIVLSTFLFCTVFTFAQSCPSVAEFRASNGNKLFFVFATEDDADYWYDQDASCTTGNCNNLTSISVVGTNLGTSESMNFSLVYNGPGNFSCLNETGTPPLRVDCNGNKYTSTGGGNFEGTITLNSMVCTYANGALPISLVNFSAKASDNSVFLTWETASELKNAYMLVEQSTDGKAFMEIGKIEGNGTTTIGQEYSFEDTEPVRGVNYYRLKQVDFDGTFEYSDIVTAYFGEKTDVRDWKIYPTNVSESQTLSVDLNSFESESTLKIEVFDLTGRNVWTQETTGGQVIQLPSDRFEPGQYIMKIDNDGELSFKKFFKS